MVTSLSVAEALRLALAAQGFDRERPRHATVRHLRDTIRRLGLLQIDCVNVVCPAHYMVPFSRLGPYDRARFDKLIYRSGEFAEHWAHEISIVPAETWPLLLQAARAHAVGTAKDLADYFRMPVAEARPRLRELVESGQLHQARVEGWREVAYLDPKAQAPRSIQAAALLSPFDPLIWCRPRVERLFGFEYRVEIFVPPQKRRYGFYVLPFLLGEKLVARVDLKADRASGRLRVLGKWFEGRKTAAVAAALSAELRVLEDWLV